jgi:hypothetical protein
MHYLHIRLLLRFTNGIHNEGKKIKFICWKTTFCVLLQWWWDYDDDDDDDKTTTLIGKAGPALCSTVSGTVTPKGSMSTEGETFQVSVLPYSCSICTPLVTRQMSNFGKIPRHRPLTYSLSTPCFVTTAPLAVKPLNTPRRLIQKKTLRDSLSIDLLISAITHLHTIQQYITHLHTNSTHNRAVHHTFTHKQYTQYSSTSHIHTQTVHLHTNSTHNTEIGK